jgi:selT/selW/selH-like putative selenoprotein
MFTAEFQTTAPREAKAPAARLELRIEYCEIGHYDGIARRLLDEVAREFPGAAIEPALVPSAGGVFEVTVGGRLVFSKRANLRLPEAAEVFYHVGQALRR